MSYRRMIAEHAIVVLLLLIVGVIVAGIVTAIGYGYAR
jgi:hypothetical protein